MQEGKDVPQKERRSYIHTRGCRSWEREYEGGLKTLARAVQLLMRMPIIDRVVSSGGAHHHHHHQQQLTKLPLSTSDG